MCNIRIDQGTPLLGGFPQYQARVSASKVACTVFMNDQGTPLLGGLPQYPKPIARPSAATLNKQSKTHKNKQPSLSYSWQLAPNVHLFSVSVLAQAILVLTLVSFRAIAFKRCALLQCVLPCLSFSFQESARPRRHQGWSCLALLQKVHVRR